MSELTTAQHLVDTIIPANIAGLTAGTNLFFNKFPANRSTTLATAVVYDTSGGEPNRNADITNFTPSVQVIAEGPPDGHTAARDAIVAIRDYIVNDFGSQVVGATTYVGAYATSDIMSLGYDENNRPQFSANFRFDKHY